MVWSGEGNLSRIEIAKLDGLAMSLEVLSDSSAARNFAARQGLGRVRHVHNQVLVGPRTSTRLTRGDSSSARENNPPDMITKAVSRALKSVCEAEKVGLEVERCRSAFEPSMSSRCNGQQRCGEPIRNTE